MFAQHIRGGGGGSGVSNMIVVIMCRRWNEDGKLYFRIALLYKRYII